MAEPVEWGKDAPHPSNLKTGDVLFPRKVKQYRDRYDAQYDNGNEEDDHPRVEGVLHPVQGASSLSGFAEHWKQKLGNKATAGNGLTWTELVEVLKLFKVEFQVLVPAWFGGLSATVLFDNMPIHPIAKLLMEGLSGDRSEGFFIGHSALVLRNNEGTKMEDVYVIEANITDFSHYGISIHPYFCDEDLDHAGKFQYDNPKSNSFPSRQMRGWVNRRVAVGEQVWQQEHSIFSNNAISDSTKFQIRQALADCSKPLLGVSYGILDSKNYGDEGRLYCFEFVDVVYRKVAATLPDGGALSTALLRLNDQQNWAWLRSNLLPRSPFKKGFEDAFVNYKNKSLGGKSVWDCVQYAACPVLTAHMLYNSLQLRQAFLPKDKSGKDTTYVQ